ncbi:MAG: endopeptidase La [Oscillospiraceae bacterium]|jgi:ATP-dependent Lon protease|nr:endopeptidase La [Oscillospiraceae bacterium]
MKIIEKAKDCEIYSELTVPVVALRGMVMFPSIMLHFDVGRKQSILALEEAMKNGQNVFITAQKDVKLDEPGSDEIYNIGVSSKVRQIIHQPGGIAKALVEGCHRAKIEEIITVKPFIRAKIKPMKEIFSRKTVPCKALTRKTKDMFVEYLNLSPRMPADLVIGVHAIKEPGQLADFIASNIPMEFEEKQKILEEANEDFRLEKTVVYLAKEFDILKIENDLAVQLKDSIDKRQKEYFLREQMKVISEELGEEEDPHLDVEKYRKKVKSLKLSKANTEKLYEEIGRFSHMPPASSEFGTLKNYLDFCISLPWNKRSKENWDIEKAEIILDEEHYGLNDVKERIIEFLAAHKLSKKPNSQILCLVGPPGVGKTSVAESLARAIGRKYARISLGGIRDEAEIRGHRKTYIGAMPGRVLSAIKRVGVKNPLILLDEIDKLSQDYHGDPGAALLETLDPEQNKAFCDHFVDLDFDLSETFFVATANDRSKIPEPLADRLEMINLYSYTHEDKFHIAIEHLIPKQLKKNGLTNRIFTIEKSALHVLIEGYTREAGIRELERKIASLMRKTAKLIVTGKEKKIKVDEKVLEKMLGPRKYKKEEEAKSIGEVGVARGLAWTSVGGETMPIEVSLMKGKGKVHVTGSLGDVMKESAKLAVSYIRSNSEKLGIKNDFYNTMDIHIHAPEGAVPKDGPSAGVTMTTALVSALSSIPARQDVAMTGEITLKGHVLPIGGLKEKTMAAYRSGMKTVIIPSGNESDLINVDSNVKKSINFVMADNLEKVFKTALISFK